MKAIGSERDLDVEVAGIDRVVAPGENQNALDIVPQVGMQFHADVRAELLHQAQRESRVDHETDLHHQVFPVISGCDSLIFRAA